MEVISKRYNHDHVSSYKNRGEKLGISNRFVRAHQAKEDRKTSRRDELTKRRGIAAIGEQNLSIEEAQDTKKSVKKSNKRAAKVIEKENLSSDQVTDQRKEKLLKWREQREMKRKAEASTKSQKTVFAVRHVQHNDINPLSKPLNTKPPKKAAPKPKETIPKTRVTRSSARIAAKPPTKPVTRGRSASSSKEVKTKKKTASKQNKEEPKHVTRQSKNTGASEPNVTNKHNRDQSNKNNEDQSCPENEESPEQSTPLDQTKEKPESFAPSNFQFTAPSGLFTFENYSKEFKFQPLSPSSTANFFKGIANIPSPKRDLITKNNFVPMTTTVQEVPSSDEVSEPNTVPVNGGQADDEQASDTQDEVAANNINGAYFRNLVSSETARLNVLCDRWEKVLESTEDLTEEVKGNIRTAVGQAQLLISQRFKQFTGLIDLSEDETADKKATMSDLQGFWDMIYFQVEDVNTKIEDLEKQKQNGWVVEEKTIKKKKTKKIVPKKAEGSKSAKPGGKSKIQELRAAMKAKMAEKKKQLQSQDFEEVSFITVLTPVKKNKRLGSHGDVILTPVRRSLRNTPINQLASQATPKVISTPKATSVNSPGLRLTPEVVSSTSNDSPIKDQEMKDSQLKEEQMPEESQHEESNGVQTEAKPASSDERTSDSTDEEMKEDKISLSSKRRSCLRSSTKRTRKSSHVFFQSPEPYAHSTAGGTPGAIVFTPGLQKNKRPSVVFTPVAVSFDSPVEEGNACCIDAGHTPALPLSGSRSLRSRTSKGTPLSGLKRGHLTTPTNSLVTTNTGTPVCQDEGSVTKRRSLRRSARKNSFTSDEETFLPDKYILPSTSSESEEDQPCQHLTPLITQQPKTSNNDDQSLLPFTPLKNSSNRLNKSLTPATRLQALKLDDSPEDRRDSVFFAQSGCLGDDENIVKDNLISFSPLSE